MKTVNSSLIRIICALVVGLVLVIWPGMAADYLVITVGVLFIVPGVFSLIGFFAKSKNDTPRYFPVAGLGSLLLGLWLIMAPGFFINILMYILGFVLLLGGLQQMIGLFSARKWTSVSAGFYITPVLILLAGLFILLSPRDSQETIFIIAGISVLVYALSELFNYLRFTNRKPTVIDKKGDIEDAHILED
ncbi:DUF308 domain-containing protein [Bacteroides sp. 214]|uniref:DUF308 domain-containing protein n=1 Tax=Bacteroides sp. 214 TaxID=2302935 RepID=UPI0013D10B2A|nr:DUF308 domain-containing protein [Bacteroides sp. 214]NDW13441.1 DUF308 domain-containing protein [Bacteroides sp. 214]